MPSIKKKIFKRIKNDLIYSLASSFIWLVGKLPAAFGFRLGAWIGRNVYSLMPYERNLIRKHLRIAFGQTLTEDEADRLGRESFAGLGRGLIELIHHRYLRENRRTYFTSEGLENMDQALALGRGAIMISAHCANWELLGAYASWAGYPVNAVARSLYDSRLNNLLVERRSQYGVRTIQRGDLAGARKMISALRNNELLALIIDQDTKVPGDFVEFFGRQAHTPTGAAQLALKFDAPVLPAFCSRKPDGTLHIQIGKPFPLVKSGDYADDLRQNTQNYTRAIEDHIKAFPGQWVWMHRRWKTRPK